MHFAKGVLGGLLCAGLALAAPAKTAPPAKGTQLVKLEEHKLKNGLRVILSEDHSAPTYSLSVTYNTGSRNERQGRTGFAHLFEHMMFQGSANVGKGEHMALIANNGGSMNGSTNNDQTNYYETLPANQLDLGLFLESDRMRSLAITQANLDNQRSTVKEERRSSYDNQPYGRTNEAVEETVYDNFAYKHSVIGSMEDLSAAALQDVSEFFRIYYAPNNAVLVLVGDFKPAEALAKIRKYFESIPSQPAPPEPDMAEPEQKAERRKTIEDPFAQIPRLDIVYKVPAGETPDWYAVNVMMNILGQGQSSRLNQLLVKQKELTVQTMAMSRGMRGPSTASVIAMVRPGKDFAEIEKLVYAEIDRLKNEPVADWELEKVRMSAKMQSMSRLASTQMRAIAIGRYAVCFHDPNLINTQAQKIAAVTKEDIQRVARKYFADTNRTVITTTVKARGMGRGGAF